MFAVKFGGLIVAHAIERQPRGAPGTLGFPQAVIADNMDEFASRGRTILFEEFDGRIEQSPARAFVEHFDDRARPQDATRVFQAHFIGSRVTNR